MSTTECESLEIACVLMYYKKVVISLIYIGFIKRSIELS